VALVLTLEIAQAGSVVATATDTREDTPANKERRFISLLDSKSCSCCCMADDDDDGRTSLLVLVLGGANPAVMTRAGPTMTHNRAATIEGDFMVIF